jgi:hypothetical protein
MPSTLSVRNLKRSVAEFNYRRNRRIMDAGLDDAPAARPHLLTNHHLQSACRYDGASLIFIFRKCYSRRINSAFPRCIGKQATSLPATNSIGENDNRWRDGKIGRIGEDARASAWWRP